MVNKNQNNIEVSGKKLYVRAGYTDTDTLPNIEDYLECFQIIINETLPGYTISALSNSGSLFVSNNSDKP